MQGTFLKTDILNAKWRTLSLAFPVYLSGGGALVHLLESGDLWLANV